MDVTKAGATNVMRMNTTVMPTKMMPRFGLSSSAGMSGTLISISANAGLASAMTESNPAAGAAACDGGCTKQSRLVATIIRVMSTDSAKVRL